MTADVWRAVVLALSCGCAVGVGKIVWGFVVRGLRRDLREVVEDVVDKKLAPIRERTEQLVPNGGSSLRDAIDRIERRLDEIEAEVAEVAEE